MPASAAVVHKWIDANGITHYSDAPPPAAAISVTQIDMTVEEPADGKDDYHSIANQWARMHRERLERERIKLEQERLKASRQAVKTEVVYVEKPATSSRHARVYAFPGYRGFKHYRSHYRHGRHHRYTRHKPGNKVAPTRRASLGFYKHVE